MTFLVILGSVIVVALFCASMIRRSALWEQQPQKAPSHGEVEHTIPSPDRGIKWYHRYNKTWWTIAVVIVVLYLVGDLGAKHAPGKTTQIWGLLEWRWFLIIALLVGWIPFYIQKKESTHHHHRGGHDEHASNPLSVFLLILISIGVIVGLASCSFGAIEWGMRHQAERGMLASQIVPPPRDPAPMRVLDFQTNIVLQAGETSSPIKVGALQSYRLGPKTVSNAEVQVLRVYPSNGSVHIVTNQFWDDVTYVTGFELRLKSTRSSGPVRIEVAIGRL